MKHQTGTPLVYFRSSSCSLSRDSDHHGFSVARPHLPPRPVFVRLPVPDPASRAGGPGRALHRAPVRLDLHGHHIHSQPGGGSAVLQRVLGERRAPRDQHRGSLHVPDPHGDLGPGPAGTGSSFCKHFSCCVTTKTRHVTSLTDVTQQFFLSVFSIRKTNQQLREHVYFWI